MLMWILTKLHNLFFPCFSSFPATFASPSSCSYAHFSSIHPSINAYHASRVAMTLEPVPTIFREKQGTCQFITGATLKDKQSLDNFGSRELGGSWRVFLLSEDPQVKGIFSLFIWFADLCVIWCIHVSALGCPWLPNDTGDMWLYLDECGWDEPIIRDWSSDFIK